MPKRYFYRQTHNLGKIMSECIDRDNNGGCVIYDRVNPCIAFDNPVPLAACFYSSEARLICNALNKANKVLANE